MGVAHQILDGCLREEMATVQGLYAAQKSSAGYTRAVVLEWMKGVVQGELLGDLDFGDGQERPYSAEGSSRARGSDSSPAQREESE